jgi:hypothetical protein
MVLVATLTIILRHYVFISNNVIEKATLNCPPVLT